MTLKDVDIAPHPPKKRRQMEQVLDVELATWLASDKLTPSERKRCEIEKQRRKEARKRETPPMFLAVFKDTAGMTPQQKSFVHEYRKQAEVMVSWIANFGRRRYQEVAKQANLVVACPKELIPPERPPEGSVWAAIRYARHRGIEVKVVKPDGELLETTEEDGV